MSTFYPSTASIYLIIWMSCFIKEGAMDQVRELQREGRVRLLWNSTHGGPGCRSCSKEQ